MFFKRPKHASQQAKPAEEVPQIPSALRRNKLIFVHVPKAAGTTISLCLFGYRVGHRTIESYWKADPAFTEEAFKFTFVRHPYFRFVSAYNFLLAGGMSSRDDSHAKRSPDAFSSLRAFAEACETYGFRKSITHVKTQSEFLSAPARGRYKIFMDYVAKTELLNDHIEVLSQLVPNDLAPRLTSAKEARFNTGKLQAADIDADVFQSIRKTYEIDFENFGYDEWGTPEKAAALVSSAVR